MQLEKHLYWTRIKLPFVFSEGNDLAKPEAI